MAKNKVKDTDEVTEKDEVVYEEEVASGETTEGGEGGQGFLSKNRNLLILVVLVIIVGGVYLLRNSGEDKEEMAMAQQELLVPTLYFSVDSFPQALNRNQQGPGLLDIASTYEGTSVGNLANYYSGIAYLNMGNIAEGIVYLEDFEKGDNMISAAAYGALGYAYEQQNDFEAAAENYLKASETPEENHYSTPFYLMGAARNYESAGNNEEALSIYRKIKKEFPMSNEVYSGNIEKYIAKLSPEDLDE